MRKLTYFAATTLDGFIATPTGGHDMFIEGEGHGAWVLENLPETVPSAYRALLPDLGSAANKRFGSVLMGRHTYATALRGGVTSPYTHLRQYVFSGTLGVIADPTVELVTTDPLEFVQGLKKQAPEENAGADGIWLCGGGKLAAALLPEIDELIVKINPVVIGSGVPLFDASFAPQHFTVTDSKVHHCGVAVLTYARNA